MIRTFRNIIFACLLIGSTNVKAEDVPVGELSFTEILAELSRQIDSIYATCCNINDKPPTNCKRCEEEHSIYDSEGFNGDVCPIEDGETDSGVDGDSKVENTTFSYNQVQTDGRYGGGFGGGVSSCCGGGVGAQGAAAPQFKRHFTSRKAGIVGDFGLDQSSSYDYKLRLMVDANGKHIADIDTPNSNFSRRMVDGRDGDPMDGIFHDQLNGVVSELKLLDENGLPTIDLSLAKTAELYSLTRRLYLFEIIQMGTDYVGRLKAIKNRNGYGIDIQYKSEIEGMFTATELANSPELQWQKHTVTDATKRVTTFEYHSDFTIGGNYVISSVTLPNNKQVLYNYEQDTLSEVIYPDNSKSVYYYTYQGNFTHFHAHEVSGKKKEVVMSNNIAGVLIGTNQLTANGVQIWNQSSFLAKTVSVKNEVRYHLMSNQVKPYNLRTIYQGKGKLTQVHNGWWARQFNGNVSIPANGEGWTYATVTGSKEGKYAKWKGYPHGQLYKKTPSTLYDDQGVQYFYEYSGNLLTKKTYLDNTYEEWDYNQFRQVTRYRDRLGRVTKSMYDSRGNLLSKEVGLMEVAGVDTPTQEHAVFNKEYYPAGHANEFLLRYEWDANNNRKEFIYNSDDQLITIKEPNDEGSGYHIASSFTYDPVTKKLETSTDAEDRVTSFYYDDRERLVNITYNDDSTELTFYGETVYDPNDPTVILKNEADLVVKKKDRNGNVTKFEYDDAGRLVKTITAYATMDADGFGEQLVDNGNDSIKDCTYIEGTDIRDSCTTDGDRVDYHFDYRRRRVGSTSYPNANVSLTTKSVYKNNLLFCSEDAYGRKTYYAYRNTDNALLRTITGTVPSYTLSNFSDVLNEVRDQSNNADFLLTEYEVDVEGQTTAVIDPREIRNETQYDSRGRAIRQINDAGLGKLNQTFDTFYDANSNVSSSEDALGNVTSMTYTRRNLLKTRTVALGTSIEATESFTYYDDRRAHTHTDFRGNTSTTVWHVCCGRLQAKIDQEGNKQVFNNDYAGNFTHTAVVDHEANLTDYHDLPDNDEGQPLNTLQEITTRYDERHRPIARTVWNEHLGDIPPNSVPIAGDDNVSEEGFTSRTFYFDEVPGHDVLKPLLDELEEDNNVQDYFDSYSDGSAVIQVNPEGEVAVSIQDGVGRTVATGMYSKLSYTAFLESLNYADLDLVTWQTVSHDNIADGLVETTSVSALNNKNSARTDGAGRRIKTIDAELKETNYEYDANSNLVSVRDANGVGQDCTFDNLNRDMTCTDTYGDLTSRVYDLNNNLLSVIDARGKFSLNEYDERNRLINNWNRLVTESFTPTSLPPEEEGTNYEYDANSNVIAIWDANQAPTDYQFATRYKFDARNLNIDVAYPGHPASLDEDNSYIDFTTAQTDVLYDRTSCSYDGMGRKEVCTDQELDTVTYTYDLASRLLTRKYHMAGTALESTDTFEYDDASRLELAQKGRYNNTVTFTYDDIGRKKTEKMTLALPGSADFQSADTFTTTYKKYDKDNRLEEVLYPTGVNNTSETRTKLSKTWTTRNQLQSLTFNASPIISNFTYDDGMREETRTFDNGLISTKSYRDNTTSKDNQLASVSIAGKADLSFNYAYDPNKNVTSETSTGIAMKVYDWTTVKDANDNGFDAIDRITNWERTDPGNPDNQSWTLDRIGNWDNTVGQLGANNFNENRDHNAVHEISSITPSGQAANSITYDAKGNITLDANGNSLVWDIDNHLKSHNGVTYTYDALGRRLQKSDGTTSVLFICDGQRVIEEYENTGSGYSLTRSYVHASYIDDIIAKIEGSNKLYYHSDRQFNVRGLTNQSGNIVELYAYTPYGKQTVVSSTAVTNNNYGFTGRYLDSESGLWYFRARYFDTELGRFISRDPLGYVDGMSLYNGYFAEGFGLDPSGLENVIMQITPKDAKDTPFKKSNRKQFAGGRGITYFIYQKEYRSSAETDKTHRVKPGLEEITKPDGTVCFQLKINIAASIFVILYDDGFKTSKELQQAYGHEQRHVEHFLEFFDTMEKVAMKFAKIYNTKKEAKTAWLKFKKYYDQEFSKAFMKEANHNHGDFKENGVKNEVKLFDPLPGSSKLPKGRDKP